jgi:hypothetical protein
MNATEFELRHQKLLHQLLVAAAFLSYLYDPEDTVWRLVKTSSSPHQLERVLFLVATLGVCAGAILCTWSRAHRKSESRAIVERGGQIDGTQGLGEILYAIGLGSFFPVSGFLTLVLGDTVRVLRLILRPHDPPLSHHRSEVPHSVWGTAFRVEAVKWGILITMVVFVVTLTDRVAEYMAGASFLVGFLLNLPSIRRRPDEGKLFP